MKRSLMMLTLLSLSSTVFASSAIDWTPYLKGMTLGCQYPDLSEGITKPYLATVHKTSNSRQGMNQADEYAPVAMTYHLKNAVAFGKPITKIVQYQGYERGLKVYFKNNDFVTVRPQFKLPDSEQIGEYDMVVNSNDDNGYAIEMMEYTTLTFNKQDKSIGCFSSM